MRIPAATRERDTPSRKSRIGLNSRREMSPAVGVFRGGGQQLDEFGGLLVQLGGRDASLAGRRLLARSLAQAA